jgi:pyruvate formate lyase activating enzyme
MSELAARRGKLQGVVITGGEPTLQEDLEPFIRKVRGLGLAVKLDTNGSNPDALEHLLSAGLLDHVGLDVKAPPGKYAALTRADISPNTITRSISSVLASGVDHELRTTWAPSLLSRADLLEIARIVRGCEGWVIQRFAPSKTLDSALLAELSPGDDQMSEIKTAVEAMGINCLTR